VFQLPQVCVQYRITAGCGDTPYDGKGYHHDRLYNTIAHELFCNIDKSSSEASTPASGGDTFQNGTRRESQVPLIRIEPLIRGATVGVSDFLIP
jgi:hypothetical protein